MMGARFPCLYHAEPVYITHFYMVISLMYINGDKKLNYKDVFMQNGFILAIKGLPLCKNTRRDMVCIDVGYGGALG